MGACSPDVSLSHVASLLRVFTGLWQNILDLSEVQLCSLSCEAHVSVFQLKAPWPVRFPPVTEVVGDLAFGLGI